ncbi:MAG: ATP synthase F0 subunit B [Candidatus Korobacteraceae bacterium]
MKHVTVRVALSFLFVIFAFGALAAQNAAGASAQSSSNQQQPPSAQQQPQNPDTAAGEELTGAASGEVGEENAQFKYSKSVIWMGHLLGLGPHASYLLYWFVNFVFVVLFFVLLFRSSIPQMFRDRTQAIQKGIREAQAASAEAKQRLGDIEARLAKLDSEVAEIRSSAEREAAAEEQRILQAAEEDKRKVLEGVETEISAIARNARRELKTYAATLAVDLASRKIKVDESTDQVLLREFVGQLGKDGK